MVHNGDNGHPLLLIAEYAFVCFVIITYQSSTLFCKFGPSEEISLQTSCCRHTSESCMRFAAIWCSVDANPSSSDGSIKLLSKLLIVVSARFY